MKGQTIITSKEPEKISKAKEALVGVPYEVSETPMMLSWFFIDQDTASKYTQTFCELNFAYVRRR